MDGCKTKSFEGIRVFPQNTVITVFDGVWASSRELLGDFYPLPA
jgi:hypothetical protein